MDKIKKVIFRCDASPIIGSGHVMRCLTLADGFREQGWSCSFLCTQETVETLPGLKQSGYPVLYLDSTQDSADLLVVDHYGLDIEYERSARVWARHILVLDDLANRKHDCDVLLDQTFCRSAEDYKELVPQACHVMTGTRYALLRPQFAVYRKPAEQKRKHQDNRIKNILISLGSTNLHNITGLVLDTFKDCSCGHFVLNVVIGSQAPGLDGLKETTEAINKKGKHKAILHQNVENMAEMMFEADLAIGAGGTTSWERSCLGLPSILVEIADNQTAVINSLEQTRAIINLGHYTAFSPEKLCHHIDRLQKNSDLMIELSQNAFRICDGQGTKRVIEQIESLQNNDSLTFRKATMDDAQDLLNWRNDAQTRAASLNTEEIDLSTHMAWLKGVFSNKNRHLYIAQYNAVPVGSLRADYTDDSSSCELSWTIAPNERGKGLGKRMLIAMISQLDCPVSAIIKKDNKASIRIAEAAGMMLEKEDNGILHYHLKS